MYGRCDGRQRRNMSLNPLKLTGQSTADTDVYEYLANPGAVVNPANVTGSLANATIPGGNVTVGGLVANSTAAASANTTAIQSALTAGGLVSITMTALPTGFETR